MRKKLLGLMLMVPLVVLFALYGAGSSLTLIVNIYAEEIVPSISNGEEILVSDFGQAVQLSADVYPSKSVNNDIVWSVSSNENGQEIAQIEGDRLTVNGEGRVVLTAALRDGSLSKSVTVYLLMAGDEPKYIVLSDKKSSESSVTENSVYGVYDFDYADTIPSKVAAKIELSAKVYPSNVSQEVVLSSIVEGIAFDEENKIIGLEQVGNYSLTFAAEGYPAITAKLVFEVVNGVNVYSYQDLLYCTNRSQDGEVVVLRSSLVGKDSMKEVGGALFGFENSDGSVTCDYVEIDSSYDTKYYDNSPDLYPNGPRKLKVGIRFRKSVYGNGYTLNAHELTFPSNVLQDGSLGYSETDHFKGPLIFVSAGGLTVYGQDNIGFYLEGDSLTLDNVRLKNCDTQGDLTNYDYVGTVLEINGDNNVLKNSSFSCGRTVLRSFSNEGLVIDGCILSHAREFTLRLGSNSIVRGGNTCGTGKAEWQSKVPLFEYARNVDNFLGDNGEAPSDSSCTVKDTYFGSSGLFSIGLDAHFSGAYLFSGMADGSGNPRVPAAVGLAATSYATRLTIEGDVRFYDWKRVDGLDSTSILSGGNESLKFDIAAVIERYATAKYPSLLVGSNQSSRYVHGGIALFGGGLNLSTVNFVDHSTREYKSFDIAMDSPDFSGIEGFDQSLICSAVGYGNFTFYMYDANSSIQFQDVLPRNS